MIWWGKLLVIIVCRSFFKQIYFFTCGMIKKLWSPAFFAPPYHATAHSKLSWFSHRHRKSQENRPFQRCTVNCTYDDLSQKVLGDHYFIIKQHVRKIQADMDSQWKDEYFDTLYPLYHVILKVKISVVWAFDPDLEKMSLAEQDGTSKEQNITDRGSPLLLRCWPPSVIFLSHFSHFF